MDWWDRVGENLWALWLAAAMVLGVAELLSLDLVLLMFAAGALAGMGADLIGLGFTLQVLIAAGASVAMLAVVRPSVTRRLHNGPVLVQGHQALVGREAVVVAEVSEQRGQIKLSGEIWTARPYDPTLVIAAGAKVQVLEIDGATALVHEIPQLGI